MDDSTLRPTPSYNPNIPVVTSAGGTNIAYKDPNSPESILKKTTELNAQVAVDTKYDVAVSPYYKEGFGIGIRQGEGFGFQCGCGCHTCPYCKHAHSKSGSLQILLVVTIVLFVALVSMDRLRLSAKIYLTSLCVLLLILCLRLYHRSF